MTIAYFCIVLSIPIPVLCAGYAKFSGQGYDNRRPREFLAGLEGKAQRANYAQINFYENFAPFAAGVIVAHLLHAPQNLIDVLAMCWVGVRILYAIFYVQDLSTLRSWMWLIGLGITISLFLIGD